MFSLTRLHLAYGLFISMVSVSTVAEHSWNDFHWARTTDSFTLQVVDSATTEWQYSLTESLSQWSSTSPINLTVTASDASRKSRKRCAMVLGQMRVCNAAYGYNGWLGLATIGLDSSGHIDQGTAKVNDSYSSYWQDPAEKNHVMCQEIGHILGLGHTSEDGSSQGTCMDYSSDPNSQWPNAHDYQMLSEIYNHMDSYDSYDDGGTIRTKPCNAPPGKGCNKDNHPIPMGIRVHRGIGHEIWVAPRSDGGLWIHHIRLAPGRSAENTDHHTEPQR